ncbi:MAG TPA: hypothetical protein VF108_10640 [Actinomycetota bacterium]
MDKRVLVGAALFAVSVAGVVALSLDDGGPQVPNRSLPEAIGRPDCGRGRESGHHEMDSFEGSGFATPRDALDSALVTGDKRFRAADFWTRAVRFRGQLAVEFVLLRRDGSVEAIAAALQTDGGWLVSTMYECFRPNPN